MSEASGIADDPPVGAQTARGVPLMGSTPSTQGATRRRGTTRMRRWVGAAAAGLCLALAALCSLMWCDILLDDVVPVLQALTPVWIVCAPGAVLLALLARTRASLLGAAALVLAASVALIAFLHQPSAPHAVRAAVGTHHLRVLSLNTEVGQADAASIERAVASTHPDVIVFPEMTAAKLALVDRSGIGARFPHRAAGMIDDGARGTAILSRFAVTTIDADTHLDAHDLQTPTVVVHAPGADVVVRGVHSYPPLRDGVAQWRPQLQVEGRWQRAQKAAHLIMAGDYNATFAHPAFRAMARGLVDALPAASSNLPPTWPHGSLIPPFAQIDHVLTRGFVPQAAGTVTVAGTDHAGVWADLRY